MLNYKNFSTWGILIITFLLLVSIGAIFHNTYANNKEVKWLGYLTPTSESVWEHLKIVYLPALLIFLFYYPLLFKYYNNLWVGLFSAILLASLITIAGFYTYSGIIGTDNVFVDILLYVIAMAVGFWLFLSIISKDKYNIWLSSSIIILGLILGGLLIGFSYNPPNLNLFKSYV